MTTKKMKSDEGATKKIECTLHKIPTISDGNPAAGCLKFWNRFTEAQQKLFYDYRMQANNGALLRLDTGILERVQPIHMINVSSKLPNLMDLQDLIERNKGIIVGTITANTDFYNNVMESKITYKFENNDHFEAFLKQARDAQLLPSDTPVTVKLLNFAYRKELANYTTGIQIDQTIFADDKKSASSPALTATTSSAASVPSPKKILRDK